MNRFLAGPGNVILFQGNNIIGVAKTLTDTTFNFSIANSEVRGGAYNALFGRYFHDPNLTVNMTDAMFNFNYIAANLGKDIEEGGLSFKEEELTSSASGVLTLTETAVAVNGTILAWYKKPTDDDWTVATVSNNTITVSGITAATKFCVKYFWQNEDAESIIIPVDYVPAELHIVIINNEYAGGANGNDTTGTNRIGKLITDIPRFQLTGSMDLSLGAGNAASVSLSGSALAVENSGACEGEAYYGTMTEELVGATWEARVTGIAVENSEITLTQGATETLLVRTISNNRAVRRDNSNFTFATVSGTTTTISVATDGKITANGTGTDYVTVDLTNRTDLDAAIVKVTVS